MYSVLFKVLLKLIVKQAQEVKKHGMIAHIPYITISISEVFEVGAPTSNIAKKYRHTPSVIRRFFFII